MPLEEYRRKRKFNQTPEPAGHARRGNGAARIFVVQKHAASHLHYDFRLQIGGVMPSWAVPKGPSLNPADKRLAMMTEDHPLEYASFEGTIPEGHYGAGTVMVWDTGTYEPDVDVPLEDQLERGQIKFTLHGKKLRGSWALINTGERKWLLIKHRDEFADRAWSIDVPTAGRSGLTDRKST